MVLHRNCAAWFVSDSLASCSNLLALVLCHGRVQLIIVVTIRSSTSMYYYRLVTFCHRSEERVCRQRGNRTVRHTAGPSAAWSARDR